MSETTEPLCRNCLGTGHVCENHPNKPWEGMTGPNPAACDCGAGMPCPACCAPVKQDGSQSIFGAFISRDQ